MIDRTVGGDSQSGREGDDGERGRNQKRNPSVKPKRANIVVRNPQKFSDIQAYADALMAGSTVMVSYGDLDKSVRTRVFDYLNGVSYIIGAQVEKVNGDLIIYAPSTVGIDKEEVKKTRSWI